MDLIHGNVWEVFEKEIQPKIIIHCSECRETEFICVDETPRHGVVYVQCAGCKICYALDFRFYHFKRY